MDTYKFYTLKQDVFFNGHDAVIGDKVVEMPNESLLVKERDFILNYEITQYSMNKMAGTCRLKVK